MGLIRKSISVSTLGVFDYRSDKERIARNARLTKKAVKQGNRQSAQQHREHMTEMRAQTNALRALSEETPGPSPGASPPRVLAFKERTHYLAARELDKILPAGMPDEEFTAAVEKKVAETKQPFSWEQQWRGLPYGAWAVIAVGTLALLLIVAGSL